MTELISPGQTTCAGCGMAVAIRIISKACPKDVIVSTATSCLEVTTSAYPLTAWNVPWIHAAFETAASVASGIEAGVKRLKKPWKVLAIAGDGGTYDIGLQALSGMFERGHKVTYVCVDNEAYMNTGIQRSGSTPYGAWTTTSPPGKKSMGKEEWKKPITEIAAVHKIPYAASASIAYPQDLIAKMKKALEKQPSFVLIHCPCPPGWRFPESDTITIARLAVETRTWILYEIEEGCVKITKRVEKPRPVKEYLQVQGRFKHLTDEEIEKIQRYVDSGWERFTELEKCGRVF